MCEMTKITAVAVPPCNGTLATHAQVDAEIAKRFADHLNARCDCSKFIKKSDVMDACLNTRQEFALG